MPLRMILHRLIQKVSFPKKIYGLHKKLDFASRDSFRTSSKNFARNYSGDIFLRKFFTCFFLEISPSIPLIANLLLDEDSVRNLSKFNKLFHGKSSAIDWEILPRIACNIPSRISSRNLVEIPPEFYHNMFDEFLQKYSSNSSMKSVKDNFSEILLGILPGTSSKFILLNLSEFPVVVSLEIRNR